MILFIFSYCLYGFLNLIIADILVFHTKIDIRGYQIKQILIEDPELFRDNI